MFGFIKFTTLIAMSAFVSLAQAESLIVMDWESTVEKAINEGDPIQVNHWTVKVLSAVVPDNENVDRTADYFSVTGITDSYGVFHPDHVSIVSEVWELKNGDEWNITQWLFQTTLDGSLTSATNRLVVKKTNGRVLDVVNYPHGGLDSDEVIESYESILHNWYQ